MSHDMQQLREEVLGSPQPGTSAPLKGYQRGQASEEPTRTPPGLARRVKTQLAKLTGNDLDVSPADQIQAYRNRLTVSLLSLNARPTS